MHMHYWQMLGWKELFQLPKMRVYYITKQYISEYIYFRNKLQYEMEIK